jgi:hypothetical protein
MTNNPIVTTVYAGDDDLSITFNRDTSQFWFCDVLGGLCSFGTYNEALKYLQKTQLAIRLDKLRTLAEAEKARKAALKPYQVFYVGHQDQRQYSRRIGGAYGTQVRSVQAESHRAALCDAASISEHTTGARYLVVGPESQDALFDAGKTQARLFELERHGKFSEREHFTRMFDFDFVTRYWDNQYRYGAAGYTVREV